MTTEITPGDNGPYRVSGDFVIKDPAGGTYRSEPGQDTWLCRCGQSGNKPFCDGSHKRVGFAAAERATVVGGGAAPAEDQPPAASQTPPMSRP